MTVSELIISLKTTDREIAEKLLVEPGTVGRWRRGETLPLRVHHKPLAKLAGVFPGDVAWRSIKL